VGTFLQGENLESIDWATAVLVHFFLLRVLLEILYFLCCLGGVSVAAARNLSL
jgi:hypothetical protein